MCNELRKLQIREIQSQSLPLKIKYLISFRFPSEMREEFLCNQNDEILDIFSNEIVKAKFESLIKKYLENTANYNLLT